MGLADCLGTPIKGGSIVAYPGRRGSHVWINVGRVAGVEWFEHRFYGMRPILLVDRLDKYSGKTKRVRVERLDRVITTPFESLEQVVGGLR